MERGTSLLRNAFGNRPRGRVLGHGRDTETVFGRYDATQLNWQPQAGRWSVAQCFDHLLKTASGMFLTFDRALDPNVAPTV